jgi:diaminopimelate decarboxylase
VAVPQATSGQFGERIDTGAALRAFSVALQHPELDVVAVQAHLNGELKTVGELHEFLDAVLGFLDALYASLALEIEILDIGGNLACPTVVQRGPVFQRLAVATGIDVPLEPVPDALTLDSYVREVTHRVDAHFAPLHRRRPRVLLEPGRAMTATTQLLLGRVPQVREPDAQGVATAVLDLGLNVAEALRNERHQIYAVRERQGGSRQRYRLYGPTCNLGDLICPGVELETLAVGDCLAVMDSGAYCVPYSTCFSFPRPAVVSVRDSVATVLRRGETFEDLVSLDAMPGPRLVRERPKETSANSPAL